MSHKGSFTWLSEFTTVASDTPFLYIKNDSTDQTLAISMLIFGSSVANIFTLAQVTGTAAGTTIEGTNHEEGITPADTSSIATSFGNAAVTGLTLGKKLFSQRCLANDVSDRIFRENRIVDTLVYLRPSQDIAVFAANAGDVEVDLFGAWVG